MSLTNFGAQQPEQALAWGHKAYEEFIESFFFTKMMGQGEGAIIEHITELSKNDKGEAAAMLHLIADLHGGGITDDNQIEGRESTLDAYWQKVTLSMISKAVANKGRMADQRSVIQFRKAARPKLARWMAETMEDQIIHVASGIGFDLNLDGSPRVTPNGEDPWTNLAYAADIAAPTANRHFRWDATTGLEAGNTAAIDSADTAKYALIPELIAEARSLRVKPLRKGGKDYYVFLCHEKTMAQLWKDADFRQSIVQADARGESNAIFSGAVVTMHGAIIHPYARVYNTRGAASGQKWGSGGLVDGTRSLLLGAQALAMADIGAPEWVEKKFNYDKRQGIAISKIMGLLKPKFYSGYTNSTEDFSVLAVDHAFG